MHFSYAAKALYVSFAPNEREGTFTHAFVYLISSGKWGVFNRGHHGFFELIRQPEQIETSAYMQYDGRVRMFTTNALWRFYRLRRIVIWIFSYTNSKNRSRGR
jgi:hypothetical protein